MAVENNHIRTANYSKVGVPLQRTGSVKEVKTQSVMILRTVPFNVFFIGKDSGEKLNITENCHSLFHFLKS